MKNIFIAGAGSFGKNLIKKISSLGHQIMVVDSDSKSIESVVDYVNSAMIGDCTKENFLKSLGIPDFDICIVSLGENFRASLVVTAMLKELGAKKVISYASQEMQEKFLRRNGADEVVFPNRQVAEWVAIKCLSQDILKYTEIDSEYGIYEINTPHRWAGMTVADADTRKKYGLNILGIKENGISNMDIRPDTLLNSDSTLLVLARYSSIEKLMNQDKKGLFRV